MTILKAALLASKQAASGGLPFTRTVTLGQTSNSESTWSGWSSDSGLDPGSTFGSIDSTDFDGETLVAAFAEQQTVDKITVYSFELYFDGDTTGSSPLYTTITFSDVTGDPVLSEANMTDIYNSTDDVTAHTVTDAIDSDVLTIEGSWDDNSGTRDMDFA